MKPTATDLAVACARLRVLKFFRVGDHMFVDEVMLLLLNICPTPETLKELVDRFCSGREGDEWPGPATVRNIARSLFPLADETSMVPDPTCKLCGGCGFKTIIGNSPQISGLTGAEKCSCWHYPSAEEVHQRLQIEAGLAPKYLPLPPEEIQANNYVLRQTSQAIDKMVGTKQEPGTKILRPEEGYEAPGWLKDIAKEIM